MLSYISNADLSTIEDLYLSYKNDHHSVDKSWKHFFEGFEFAEKDKGALGTEQEMGDLKKEIAVYGLVDAYRSRGHLVSKTNPVRERLDRKARIDIEDFGLTEEDLEVSFQAGNELGLGRAKLKDIIRALSYIYCRAIGFEYTSIREPEIFEWCREKVEKASLDYRPKEEDRRHILQKLNEAVVFETFLHSKYVGQKRFSLEGGESLIPALDAVIEKGAELGAEHISIAMAHRGRLSVLSNIMGKTYDEIFNEFEGNNTIEDDGLGDGDVKYHLGFSSQVKTSDGKQVYLDLAPNPSHLEAVDSVMLGYCRAKIDDSYNGDHSKIIPIIIHGDGAVAGQGIIYELAQMSKLRGYDVGGTVHIIINNQVSFTTDFKDARSSIYCTDISQVIEAPEIHVNGDDPEAVVFAVKFATEFRQQFKRDIFVDIVCYRKHGHNESDEPKFTQPALYKVIQKHPSPREKYLDRLIRDGKEYKDLAQKMDKEFKSLLSDRQKSVKQNPLPYKAQKLEKAWDVLRKSKPEDFDSSPNTGISLETIDTVAKTLTQLPKGFNALKQISRLIESRKKMFFEDKILNWASAELLAYGSLLLENIPVRISGQDVQRGTFSHRHAVLTDVAKEEKYTNLKHISKHQAPFHIYNSLLSEYGVLGFEFGYAQANPNMLVVWEAQFGDFANGAQVIIDQFISSCESKWNRMNGMVMFLPHGYEGQGPEHSNARPERFLQLSAEYNMIVANLTTPANIFHALRRQLTWAFRKPLIVMTPKSLLRLPECVSPTGEFVDGKFRETYPDTTIDATKARRVLLCTGKVYYDLHAYRTQNNIDDVAIIRVEQLHPFPHKQVNAELHKYNVEDNNIYWVQEEPANMGAWTFVLRVYSDRRLRLVSRKPSASPATGFAKKHGEEQNKLMKEAFKV